MSRALAVIAAVLFAAATLTHLSTFWSGRASSLQRVWPLHLLTMAVFACMVISIVRLQNRQSKSEATGLIGRWRASVEDNKHFQANLMQSVPFPFKALCVAAFIYAGINFAVFMVRMDGSPAEKNGTYYLHSHGNKIRDITKAEYEQLRLYTVRGASGHWIVFTVIPLTYFWAVQPRMRAQLQLQSDSATAT